MNGAHLRELEKLDCDPLIRIEVPRWSVVKPRGDGQIDFISPLPCPYNYGSILGTCAADGDPIDAVVLGNRLARGSEVRVPLRAVMGFIDNGLADPKIICSVRPLSARERRWLERFFRFYALCKKGLNLVRGRFGTTECTGWARADFKTWSSGAPHGT